MWSCFSFFYLLGWWPPRWRQQPESFLFRVSPGTLSDTPCRANLNSKLQPAFEITGHTCNKKLSQKTKNPPTENQRFQFWRLSVNYNWSMNALSIKIKDFNQEGWPQIMPSSAKPGQAQPEALRFLQLKKKNFWGFSPLVLTIERPLQIY